MRPPLDWAGEVLSSPCWCHIFVGGEHGEACPGCRELADLFRVAQAEAYWAALEEAAAALDYEPAAAHGLTLQYARKLIRNLPLPATLQEKT